MDTKTIEANLIDEIFAMLNQQVQQQPLQIAAPQSEPARPYFAGHQKFVERQQIEAQISALVQAGTAHVYALLSERFAEMQQAQQIADAEQQARAKRQAELLRIEQAARAASPCAPSRQTITKERHG